MHKIAIPDYALRLLRERGQDAAVRRIDPQRAALLVVDMQNDVVAKAHRRDDVIANIGSLIDRARAEDVPLIWVQHSDENLILNSEGWRFVPELQRREPDRGRDKRRVDEEVRYRRRADGGQTVPQLEGAGLPPEQLVDESGGRHGDHQGRHAEDRAVRRIRLLHAEVALAQRAGGADHHGERRAQHEQRREVHGIRHRHRRGAAR